MSYFNRDQQDYMDDLAKRAPETKCWCGWFPLGECHSCPANKTLADRKKVACPGCNNAPANFGAGEITHRIGCKLEPVDTLSPRARTGEKT